MAIRSEAIASSSAIALSWRLLLLGCAAIAIRLEAIAIRSEAIPSSSEYLFLLWILQTFIIRSNLFCHSSCFAAGTFESSKVATTVCGRCWLLGGS